MSASRRISLPSVISYTAPVFTWHLCLRWGEEHKFNYLVNHMKDIHEVKDNQPLNHVRCRGVAGSVHLTYSMDRKGGTRPHPQQHHPVPHGGPFSKKFPPTTRSPPKVHNVNSTAQPGQHQKAHNDIDGIPPHPHHNHTTHIQRGSPPQQPFIQPAPGLSTD